MGEPRWLTESLERMRASCLGCSFGRAGPVASLSFDVSRSIVVADYTLTQAVSQFLAGECLAQHVVAGLPFVWIGRAGKLLQFLAAWAVIVEIIGVIELRNTLSQMRAALSMAQLRACLSRIWRWLILLLAVYAGEPRRTHSSWRHDVRSCLSPDCSIYLVPQSEVSREARQVVSTRGTRYWLRHGLCSVVAAASVINC